VSPTRPQHEHDASATLRRTTCRYRQHADSGVTTNSAALDKYPSRALDPCPFHRQFEMLKCLAVLPRDLSLITIHISDCRQFSDIHILQGSVATYLRSGGIFK